MNTGTYQSVIFAMELLETVASGLRLDKNVVARAQDYLRTLLTKLPIGTLRKAESCRHVLVIDLACFTLQETISRAEFLRHSGLKEKEYKNALNICKKALDLVDKVDFEVLSIKFNTPQLIKPSHELLNTFRINYVDHLHISRRANIKLSSAGYQAAVFYLAALKARVRIGTAFIYLNLKIMFSHSIIMSNKR